MQVNPKSIAETNTPLNNSSNCGMDYSVLKHFYSEKSFIDFSIKYVSEGAEHYKVNGTAFKIESGQYLLAGFHSKGTVVVDSKEDVKGICISLSSEVLSEVTSNYIEPTAAISDLSLNNFFSSSDYPENKYLAQTTHLGHFLTRLQLQIKNNVSQPFEPSKEFYYLVSEHLVADHKHLHKPFQRLAAVKNTTKKDLFRKMLLAKDFIDFSFLEQITIAEIAQTAGLSEYYFFRLFKTSFGISPYQYILHKRLFYAHQLLKTTHFSVSETALAAGFIDIFSFSRAFKKRFGYPPSGVI